MNTSDMIQIPPPEAPLVGNLSPLPIFEEKRFSSNLCDSIKYNVVLAELWSDRSKGWTWAWSWSWPWSRFDIGRYFCNDEHRYSVTLKYSAAWVTEKTNYHDF